ncbi:MAG TPA: hypothetical protein VEQ58_13660, partial [Polyangiaceae bacterium]|nr:hypothetical protein [Polyangiaceae bacterium]
NRQTAGALVLCLAALVRIEAFMVLFWLAVGEQLLQRKWRAFIVSSLAVAVTVAITVVVYYRIQGSVARFNAGGPAVGYLFSREPSVVVRFVGSLKYTAIATYEMLFEHCGFPFLGAPALVAFVRAPTRRFYLATFGIAAFLMVYVTAGQGNSDVRYFDFITPLVAAFGAAGVVQLFELGGQVESKLLRRLLPLSALLGVACFVLELPNVVCSVSLVFITVGAAVALRQLRASLPSLPPWLASGAWLLLIAALFVSAVRSGAWGEAPKPHGYTVDAKSMIEHELFPRGQRVLIDDDVLYGVLVDDYKVFRRAGSLQNFNVQDDAQREEILGKTDYLVMSRGGHFFFYLRYDPLQRGKSDPFRAAVLRARNGKEANAYGYRITPFKTTRRLLILKVEKA